MLCVMAWSAVTKQQQPEEVSAGEAEEVNCDDSFESSGAFQPSLSLVVSWCGVN
jgi:hypothetical protein